MDPRKVERTRKAQVGVWCWYWWYGVRGQSLEATGVVSRKSDWECSQSWIAERKQSSGEKAVATVEEWKVVVGSRYLPSVRQPKKRMESRGAAVGVGRSSSGVLTV